MSYDDVVKEINTMSIDQKIVLVAAIWDQISDSPETIPVPKFHEETLASRAESFSGKARSWREIRKDYGLR